MSRHSCTPVSRVLMMVALSRRPYPLPLGDPVSISFGFLETVASRGFRIVSGASLMQGLQGLGAASSALFAVQVEGQAAADLLGRAHRVDAALRLAEAAVAAFHRVAGRAQQGVVQEQQ